MSGGVRIQGDLPAWLWAGFPPLMLLLLVACAVAAPGLIPAINRSDTAPGGGGLAEHGTVLVLIPGIVAGFLAFRARSLLPDWRLGWWILMWTLASFYFAGEEISWGQHLFHWETPEVFRELNKQQEMNLHNTSSWFNQKPRALVELWIIFSGLAMPAWRWLRGAKLDPARIGYWLWPTVVAVPAAALFMLFRAHKWVAESTGRELAYWLSESEVREYYVAVFLSIYLMSIWQRTRARA
jgi:hypothetical protein